MKPELSEALRALRMADKDIAALDYIYEAPVVADSIVGFHAQQAVEKSLKAVLYACSARFGRTHDLTQLCALVSAAGLALPLPMETIAQLTPYAVTLRYDKTDLAVMSRAQAHAISHAIRAWAGTQVDARIMAEPGCDDQIIK
jgi:hypothetical protein